MRPATPLAGVFMSACARPTTAPGVVGGRGRHALTAAAAVVLAACGGSGPTGAVTTNGSIRGTVTDNTGAIVANAAVALTGSAQAARTTSSGADGVYTLADLLPGTYTLAVTPPVGFTAGAASTAAVTVAGGAQANASAFVLSRAARIGFFGYSHGAMIGVHFVGIERRLKAAVITAGYGGNVTAVTNEVLMPQLAAFSSCAARAAWFRDNVPIEPIRFISSAAPTALLFQIARFDTAVPLDDAQAVYDAASSPKEVLYYDSGHALPPQAALDRQSWLAKHIGIDP